MPELIHAKILPTGEKVATPPLDDAALTDYRFVLEGSFRFAYSDEIIDAAYRFRPDGSREPVRHNLIAWSPRTPLLDKEDVAGHRYVFRVPANWSMDGQSLTVGLDVPAFIREYKLPDSEILSQLTGELAMSVQSEAIGGALPVWIWPGAAIPVAGLAAGTAWIIRRRMSFGGLDGDLRESISLLYAKAAAALRLAAKQKRTSRELRSRIAALQRGAVDVAQRLQSIRRSLAMTDPDRTASEIQTLESRLEAPAEATTRHDLQAALEQKRKALAAANELRSAEERCRLRLTKIEGVIDSACLQLQRANVGEKPGPVEDTVLRELDSEVRAVGEVAREEEAQAYLKLR